MAQKTATSKPFDKYKYYIASVQAPEADIEFFEKIWQELRPGKRLALLREDFCGTFIVCCQWVKSKSYREAIGVDIDFHPLEYGYKTHYAKLLASQQNRIKTCNASVLSQNLPPADMIVANNFSYYLFKTRKEMLKYFLLVHKKLYKEGLFVIDCFGGSECYEPNEEKVKHNGFSYFWDQTSFDPVSNYARFDIHFKLKGEKKRLKVFSYDWRMWSIPELRDILTEAGFSKSHVYWEGTTSDGEGDGHYTKTETGEDCQSWVAYIVAEK